MHYDMSFRRRLYAPTIGRTVKCDLCGGDPECAKACPTKAPDICRLVILLWNGGNYSKTFDAAIQKGLPITLNNGC